MTPEENRFCLYHHYKKSNGAVFYIGIGSIRRAYSSYGRNNLWNKIVSKHGFFVRIIHRNNSWSVSCNLEKCHILQFGRIDNNTGILANLTDGGEGMPGVIPSINLIESARKRAITNNPMKRKENKDKISIWMTNRIVSDITKQKQSNRLINKAPKFIINGTHFRKSGGQNPSAVKVIDIKENKIYETISGAAKTFAMKRTTLIAMLNGQNKNKTNLEYYEQSKRKGKRTD